MVKEKRSCCASAAKLLGTLMLLGGFVWYENCTIQTEVFSLRAKNLPQAFAGFRVAQISDLHGEIFGENSKTLIKAVQEQKPDLIAITGDLTSEKGELSALRPLLAGLAAIAPAYYVTGNHEWVLPREKRQALFDLLEETGVTRLKNEYRLLERNGQTLVLAGVDDPNGPYDQKTPEQLVAEIREACGEDACILMLSHRNDKIDLWARLGVEMVLCGHAHGGLVRIPGVGGLLGTRFDFFPEYTEGVYTQKNTQVLVSRGLGRVAGKPLRVLNRPQLVIAELGQMCEAGET